MYPDDLRYSKTHEWIRSGDPATVGITHYAQDELGDVVYVELPDVGRALEAKARFGSVESVKTVSDLYAPASGAVAEVNTALADHPELINNKSWVPLLSKSRKATPPPIVPSPT